MRCTVEENRRYTEEISFPNHEKRHMPRPPGSPNRSPRELRAEARRLMQVADLKEKLAKAKGKPKK
jgi:hypothetical protein